MNKTQTFEQAIGKLEEITKQLEDPSTTLEDSISAFEEGVSLIRYCREALTKAEARITVLTEEDSDGSAQ